MPTTKTMQFELLFTDEAEAQYQELLKTPHLKKPCKAVQKALALMETNLRHPGLKTHKYSSLTQAMGQEVFEAYAQNRTPGAYRIFWTYGPDSGQITILSITPHP